jgi:hypothetical protein
MTASDPERTSDLIQRIVDAEATTAERAELDAIMSTSPAARADYESMRDLVRQLDTWPIADAPLLKNEVLENLRGHTVVSFHSRKRRRVFGLAWAAAAAVIVGIAIDQFRSREPVEPRDAAATMTRRGVMGWPVVARETSEGTTLTVRRENDRYAVILEPVTAGVSLSWEPQQLTFSTAVAGKGYDGSNTRQGVATFAEPANQAMVILGRVRDASGPAVLRAELSGREILKIAVLLE